jgi:hypothetical protein
MKYLKKGSCDVTRHGPQRTWKVRIAMAYSSAISDKTKTRYIARLSSVVYPLSSCSLRLMMPCFVRYVMN